MKELFPFYKIGDFINEPNNPTEFEVMRFDEIEELNVDDLHKHTFYEIIWIEKGKSKQVDSSLFLRELFRNDRNFYMYPAQRDIKKI